MQGASIIQHHAPTYDEATHLASGYAALVAGDFSLNSQVPPLIKVVLASPLYFGYHLALEPDPGQWRGAEARISQSFLYGLSMPADRVLAMCRFGNLALGTLLIVVIGWWAYRLWGGSAALVAIALAALEPNLVAHSSLFTTDVGATLFIVLALYLFWESAASGLYWLWIATGLTAGLALVSKYSALTLIPIAGTILAGHVVFGDIVRHTWWPRRAASSELLHRVIQVGTVALLLCLPAMIIIPAAYFFQGYAPWWSGLQRFLEQAAAGQPAFFLGQYSYVGWWSYFPVAFLIKTPVGTLLLIAASLVFYRAGAPLGQRHALFLLGPVVMVFLVSTQVGTNIGLRHVLAVYPLLFILASRLATVRLRRPWLMPIFVGMAIAATAASTLRIAPHQLAYFNELVGGPAEGYRYLADSNLDWGQDLKDVKRFMEQEGVPIVYLSYFGTAPPAYYGIRYQYAPGSWPLEWPPPADDVPADLPRKLLIISVSNLQEVHTHFSYPPLFARLRALNPIARIGYSIHVYDLSGDVEALLELAEAYRKTGLTAMANAEARKAGLPH
jgi:hypothetical protein